jgi:hypothetical protein
VIPNLRIFLFFPCAFSLATAAEADFVRTAIPVIALAISRDLKSASSH